MKLFQTLIPGSFLCWRGKIMRSLLGDRKRILLMHCETGRKRNIQRQKQKQTNIFKRNKEKTDQWKVTTEDRTALRADSEPRTLHEAKLLDWTRGSLVHRFPVPTEQMQASVESHSSTSKFHTHKIRQTGICHPKRRQKNNNKIKNKKKTNNRTKTNQKQNHQSSRHTWVQIINKCSGASDDRISRNRM